MQVHNLQDSEDVRKWSWYDKHNEEIYMNDDGHDKYDKKDGSHEIFSNVIRRIWPP